MDIPVTPQIQERDALRGPQPPTPSSTEFVLPGWDAVHIENPVSAKPEATLTAIRQEQKRAQEMLEARLKQMYVLEGNRLERELATSYAKETEQLNLSILEEVFDAVRKLGAARAYPLSRITFIAGFPDPEPNAPRTLSKLDENWVETKLANQLAAMRKQIIIADQDFDEAMRQIKAKVKASSHARLQELQDQVKLFRDELELRAKREAQQQVQNNLTEIGIQLGESGTWDLPAIAKTSQPAKFEPQHLVGEVRSPSIARSSSAKSDLDLFLKVHRYERGEKGRARDATKEFLAWRIEVNRGH